VPSPPSPAQGCPAAFERLARLAAGALGARAGGVTLLRDGVLTVAGGHRLPPDGEPTEECHRIVATGEAVLVGGAYAGVPVSRTDGTVIGTLCVMQRDRDPTPEDVGLLEDVAASVVAELELSEAAATARREQRIGAAVIDVATDCLIQVDARGQILSWSPSAERTFGHDQAGAVGRSLIDLLSPPELAEGYRTSLAGVVRGERELTQRVEAVSVHRDGHRMPVEISLTPLGADTYMACVRDLSDLRTAEERMEVAERRFRALVEHVPATTWSCAYDEAGDYDYVSPQIEQLTGLPAEHFLGSAKNWIDSIHPDDRERIVRQIDEDYAAERGFEAEYRMVHRDGTIRWVWDRESIVRNRDGRPVYGQGVVIDLTAMRETQEALDVARRQLESIIAVAPMILTALDADGYVTFVEGRGLETLGLRPQELIGTHALDITPGEAPRQAVLDALAGTTTSATVTVGETTFDVSWQPVIGTDGELQGVVSVALDATARRRNEAHLRYLAHHDVLTGAPNRSLLELEIGGREGELAVVVVDVVGFKTVNDSLGHEAGDEALRELARRLGAVAGAHEAFLARVGADEFALLLSARDGRSLRRDAERAAHAALAAVHEPIAVAGSEFVVTAATGAALGASSSGSGDLLRHADIALGQAKLDDLPLVWHVAEDDEDVRARLTLTARIRNALTNGEFSLHYQPIHDIQAERVSGMEALIRWNDPERGLVSPDDFIPAAEASGLIDDIGRWVVDEVCRQWRSWADGGLRPAIGFNVAPRELRRPDFAQELAAAVERHGVDPSYLVVEITERAAMREPERTDAVLRELKDVGARVAIDDFGADHSSLARLRALRVDILKIDRDFLRGVPEEREAAAIVTAVLSLASALGMSAVAEGVETAEQLHFLQGLGCDRVQGYHIARPMPARDATAFMRRHPPVSWRGRHLREVA
jgi:PAS domain S-box-containing protein/diguanylate cyclase (GGDEF)-like protein